MAPLTLKIEVSIGHHTYNWISSSLTAAGVNTPRSVKSKLMYSADMTHTMLCVCQATTPVVPHACGQLKALRQDKQSIATTLGATQTSLEKVRHCKPYLVECNLVMGSQSWLPGPSRDQSPHASSPPADPVD